MKVQIYLKSRANGIYAEALYEDGVTTVLSGGRINPDFAAHIRGGKTARDYRNNREYVSEDMVILKDCSFSSPSTASQFVTGRSTNGYETWKVDKKRSLGSYLKEKGIR